MRLATLAECRRLAPLGPSCVGRDTAERTKALDTLAECATARADALAECAGGRIPPCPPPALRLRARDRSTPFGEVACRIRGTPALRLRAWTPVALAPSMRLRISCASPLTCACGAVRHYIAPGVWLFHNGSYATSRPIRGTSSPFGYADTRRLYRITCIMECRYATRLHPSPRCAPFGPLRRYVRGSWLVALWGLSSPAPRVSFNNLIRKRN